MNQHETQPIVITTRGDVSTVDQEYGRRKVEHLIDQMDTPVLFARLELTVHADPARQQPAFAKAELDRNGRIVRAHATAGSTHEAIDALDARLRERIARTTPRERSRHLRHRDSGEHQWHHAGDSPPRPGYFPRPADERDVVRHKAFSYGALTPEEAADDLERLDHDFYLFRNFDTGEDNVIARSAEQPGRYELLAPGTVHVPEDPAVDLVPSKVRPVPMTMTEAREFLDLSDAPYVFFVGADDERGRVLYRRYDGHYGLVTPADLDE